MKEIKKKVVKTPLHYLLIKLISVYEFNIVYFNSRYTNKYLPTTAYCISPYKTGTTFVNGLFERYCNSAHEPLQYTTLKNIDNELFLKNRSKFLKLDLECSGFFSNKLSQIRKFSPNSPVLYMIRSPDQWIESVINYFSKISQELFYSYINRLYFDKICKEKIENFFKLSINKQEKIIKALIEYWIMVYTEAKNDKKCLIIKLEDVKNEIEEIEDFFGLKSTEFSKVWQRKNKYKNKIEIKNYINIEQYKKDIEYFGYTC